MRRTLKPWICSLLAAPAIGVCGCQLPPPLFGPRGPMGYQQREASVFDPYADNDLGPEVVGGRPRDYQKQAPEPVRSKWYSNTVWGQ